MNPRVAVTGSSTVSQTINSSLISVSAMASRTQDSEIIDAADPNPALVLSRFAVALVLLAFPAAATSTPGAPAVAPGRYEIRAWLQQQPQYRQPQYPQQGNDYPQQGYPQSNPQGYDQQPAASNPMPSSRIRPAAPVRPAQGMNAEQLEQLVAPSHSTLTHFWRRSWLLPLIRPRSQPPISGCADGRCTAGADCRRRQCPDRLGSQRQSADGISAGPVHDEPEPAVDHLSRQRLLQPAPGPAPDRAGVAPAGPGRRQPADHAPATGHDRPGIHCPRARQS